MIPPSHTRLRATGSMDRSWQLQANREWLDLRYRHDSAIQSQRLFRPWFRGRLSLWEGKGEMACCSHPLSSECPSGASAMQHRPTSTAIDWLPCQPVRQCRDSTASRLATALICSERRSQSLAKGIALELRASTTAGTASGLRALPGFEMPLENTA